MEKILQELGLDPKDTVDQAVAAIKALKDAPPKNEPSEREKRIREKMKFGLSREVAEEAVRNQEAEDARVKKESKTK